MLTKEKFKEKVNKDVNVAKEEFHKREGKIYTKEEIEELVNKDYNSLKKLFHMKRPWSSLVNMYTESILNLQMLDKSISVEDKEIIENLYVRNVKFDKLYPEEKERVITFVKKNSKLTFTNEKIEMNYNCAIEIYVIVRDIFNIINTYRSKNKKFITKLVNRNYAKNIEEANNIYHELNFEIKEQLAFSFGQGPIPSLKIAQNALLNFNTLDDDYKKILIQNLNTLNENIYSSSTSDVKIEEKSNTIKNLYMTKREFLSKTITTEKELQKAFDMNDLQKIYLLSEKLQDFQRYYHNIEYQENKLLKVIYDKNISFASLKSIDKDFIVKFVENFKNINYSQKLEIPTNDIYSNLKKIEKNYDCSKDIYTICKKIEAMESSYRIEKNNCSIRLSKIYKSYGFPIEYTDFKKLIEKIEEIYNKPEINSKEFIVDLISNIILENYEKISNMIFDFDYIIHRIKGEYFDKKIKQEISELEDISTYL